MERWRVSYRQDGDGALMACEYSSEFEARFELSAMDDVDGPLGLTDAECRSLRIDRVVGRDCLDVD